jgi:hypothetical protein
MSWSGRRISPRPGRVRWTPGIAKFVEHVSREVVVFVAVPDRDGDELVGERRGAEVGQRYAQRGSRFSNGRNRPQTIACVIETQSR